MDWDQWFQQHAAALLLYARQWTRSRAEAEDALQDGFLRYWRSSTRRSGVGPAPGKDLPLLYTAIKHAAFDRARSARRRRNREETAARDWYGESGMFEEPADGKSARGAPVEHALRELPPEQREVLVLKIWGRLTFRQIGETLGTSPNTAASRYRYALAMLKRLLRSSQEPPEIARPGAPSSAPPAHNQIPATRLEIHHADGS